MSKMVILTRGLGENLALQALLDKEQIGTQLFPVLEIHPLTPQVYKQYDYVIFISKNAVKFGKYALKMQQNAKILAVGSTTAYALMAAGHQVALYPSSNPSSQALLMLPEVQCLTGKHILIIRGVGGEETLKTQLELQHNTIEYLEVYERLPRKDISPYLSAVLVQLQYTPIILITSIDSFNAFITHLKPYHCLALDTRFVVASRRIQTYLHTQGFFNIIVASVHNIDIIKGIKAWLP